MGVDVKNKLEGQDWKGKTATSQQRQAQAHVEGHAKAHLDIAVCVCVCLWQQKERKKRSVIKLLFVGDILLRDCGGRLTHIHF
jgi:hypothetical protein